MRSIFPCGLTTRRELIWEMGGGFASLALLVLPGLVKGRRKTAGTPPNPPAPL